MTIIDTRDRWAFARGHIPGSTWIGKGDSFSSWTGWLMDIDQPIALVVDDETAPDALVTELTRIGFDTVKGWTRLSNDASTSIVTPAVLSAIEPSEWRDTPPQQILDVRDAYERIAKPIPGSIEVHLPDISADTLTRLDANKTVGVVCESGYRATVAGSLLLQLGYQPMVLAKGGAVDV